MLLRQEAFVFGLQVLAPFRFELEILSEFPQNLHGLGVRQADEVVVRDVVQGGGQGFVHEAAEQVQVGAAFLPDEVHQVADHLLSQVHVVVQVGEGHLRLYHPELGDMAGGVGVLRAEGRTEGIDVPQTQAIGLHLQLPRYREVRLLAEEVAAEVN